MKIKRTWKLLGVPHSEPHPLYGSLNALYRKHFIEWLTDQYNTYIDEPYFGIWLFWRPCLVIRSPEIAGRILIKDFNVFRDRLANSGKGDPIGRLNLFTLKDPLWSTLRKKLTPVFTSAKLRMLQNLKSTKSEELVQRIHREMETGRKFDLRDVLADFTTDVIGAAAFGAHDEATLTGESPMRAITKDFMNYSLWRSIGLSFIFFSPELVDLFRFSFFPRQTTDYYRKVYNQVAKSRGKWFKDREVNDLLDILLKIKWEASTSGEGISDDMMMAQATVFLQGGFDTTAVALTFAFLEIAYNTQIQEKLYNELYEAKKQSPNKDLNSEVLSKLPYLNAVIKETLRKYPAMGWLDRIAANDYKIDDKLTIKKGTPVFICANGMQYDEKYFKRPNEFNPERFLAENEKNITPYTYLPFGDGPRNCIGLRFGHQTMLYAISRILLEFEVIPHADTPRPEEVKPDKLSMFLGPDKLISLNFVPRNYLIDINI